MNIQEAKNHDIQRKDDIEKHRRTEGKTEAADWIEENIISEGRWPVNLEDMAEESGWSRQHIAGTLRDYFEVAGGGFSISANEGRAHIEFDIPGDVEEDSYIRGYMRGWLDCKDR